MEEDLTEAQALEGALDEAEASDLEEDSDAVLAGFLDLGSGQCHMQETIQGRKNLFFRKQTKHRKKAF